MRAESSVAQRDDDSVGVKKKKKLGGSDRIREKKKLAAEQARQEAALNQRGECHRMICWKSTL